VIATATPAISATVDRASPALLAIVTTTVVGPLPDVSDVEAHEAPTAATHWHDDDVVIATGTVAKRRRVRHLRPIKGLTPAPAQV